MALEFFTGLQGVGSLNDSLALFDAFSGTISYAATGGYNNKTVIGPTGVDGYIRKNVTAKKTQAWGFHVLNIGTYNYSTTANRSFIYCTQTGVNISVWNASDGLEVRINTTQVAKYPSVIIPNTLTHFAIKVYSHSSAGTIEIKINGVSLGVITGLNTGGNDFTYVDWKGHFNNTGIRYATFYVDDTLLDEVIPVMCKPASDDSVAFSRSAGSTNYELIDDLTQDGDTTYVQSGTVGAVDIYGYEDIPSGYSVVGISLITVARKDDAGARTLQPIVEKLPNFSKYRFKILNCQGGLNHTNVSIAELLIYDSDGTNIIGSGTASAVNGTAGNAVDGNNNTIWSSSTGDPKFSNLWWQYDFGELKEALTYSIVTRSDGYLDDSITEWEVYGWNGSDWELINTQTTPATWTLGEKRDFVLNSLMDIGSEIVLATTYPGAVSSGIITTVSNAPNGEAWDNNKFNAAKWGFKVAS